MKRTVLIILGVLLVVGLVFFIQGRQKTKAATEIVTAEVKKRDFVKEVNSSGKTSASTSVDLKFQTSGKLSWVGVKEGDSVRAYQAIAGMDVREVQKNLEKALRDYSSERNDFEQERQDPALTDTMRRILQKNQWDLEKAVLDVELKHLALEYATLVTPIACIVTHIDTPIAGVNITPASAVFSIADPTSLVFVANIDEIDVGALEVGLITHIALDAFPDASFSGKISYVSFTSETSGGGATVFPVKVLFDQPENLRIGLNGDITIAVEQENDVLLLPIEAIREDDEKKYVYRKIGNRYEKVEVSVGSQNGQDIVVISGLSDGDTVVTKGFASIPKK